MAPKVGVVTQARMTSTRLPGKILRSVHCMTLLEHHLHRLGRADLDAYVATTTNTTDDPVVELARGLDVPTHRGSEHDVLARYAGAAEQFGLDVVVRVTSDCPLIDGDLITWGVDEFLRDGRDHLYLSNTVDRTYPRGMDFEVFWAQALFRADRDALDPAEREHVTPYLYANPRSGAVVVQVTGPADHSRFRLTVDTEADLALVTRLIEDFDAAHLGVEQLVAVLEEHPELARLNESVIQKGIDEEPTGPPLP